MIINNIFIINVNSPRVGVNLRLNTQGRLEIGDVPSAAFVIKAIPKEFIITPIMINIFHL